MSDLVTKTISFNKKNRSELNKVNVITFPDRKKKK